MTDFGYLTPFEQWAARQSTNDAARAAEPTYETRIINGKEYRVRVYPLGVASGGHLGTIPERLKPPKAVDEP